MKRSLIAAAGIAFMAGGTAAAALFVVQTRSTVGPAAPPAHPAWAEVQWPFAMDEWGQGKAFRCAAADCGTKVDVYVRAKIGFCDCVRGVTDDNELDRLSDFALMGDRMIALGNGRPIAVGWMKGRSRSYAATSRAPSQSSALAIAFNDHCDALVATAVLASDKPALLEPAVIALLNGKMVLDWTKLALGR